MKKRFKSVISVIAASAMTVSLCLFSLTGCQTVEPFTGVQKYDEKIVFSTSFEDNETGLLENTAEGNAISVGSKNGSLTMTAERSNGPEFGWGGISRTGWTGKRALKVNGVHQGSGEASAANVIYKDLNIAVTKNTFISYLIYPSTLSDDSYDYEYTQTYIALDAVFTDGTRLCDLQAVDQNGFLLDPVSQGESNALYVNQWNYIRADIGAVAEGKTVDKLLVYYRKPDNNNRTDSEFLSYIDDVTVSEITGMQYDHLSDYVNILRGTNSTSKFSRGLATPGVTYPHGFNFFTPVTAAGDKQPYYYQLSGDRTTMSSIQITHVASYWVGYYGTWQFMPSTKVNADKVRGEGMISADARAAEFDHNNETATCYYYSVQFNEGSNASNVKVELTPTFYGAVVRFTFPDDASTRSIIFTSENGGGGIDFADGMNGFKAYSNNINQSSRRMFVCGKFSTAAESVKNVGTGGVVTFKKGTKIVEMTLATSFINFDQAEKNYNYDFSKTKDFDKVCANARQTWDDALGVVEIEGASFTEMVTYYSCLYRALAYPNLYTENTGTQKDPVWQYASPYSGTDIRPSITDGSLVCNTGLWDTYRTAWPWYSTYSKDNTLINGLLGHYKDSGWNGAWMVVRGTQIMIGTHSDIIYADAAVKGVEFDYQTAFESMLRNAATARTKGGVGREEQETSVFRGYVSKNTPRGLSWTLDNTLNDYGLYVMAQKLGLQDEAAYYENRAKAYVTVFNSDAGFFIGKDENGNFVKNKNNYDPTDLMGDYTESNGWDMAFNMVYDAGGLYALYGGSDGLAAKLDELFSTPIRNVNRDTIHEVREARELRMGQYYHSNQVAHHLAYMYDFTNQPYKTQELVRKILARCYVGSEIGQGYVGDEDNGEQSAWYVYSALGFYPTALATGQYTIGSPLFSKVTLHFKSGDVTITAKNNSTKNVYIKSCTVNGENWNKTYITQEMLDSGADIVFEMTDQPMTWACSEDSRPYSLTPYGESISYMTDGTKSAAVSSNSDNNAALTDDTSNTAAKFSSDAEITFAFAAPYKAQIVTLTSASNDKPTVTGYTLSASADGANFVTLDERSDIEFMWGQYTRPFLIPQDKQDGYIAYKLILKTDSGSLKIAEVELIG